MRWIRACFFALLCGFLTDSAYAGTVPDAAEKTSPIKEGNPLPKASVTAMDGKKVPLNRLVSNRPALLIFYRGGWCPICNRHLEALATHLDLIEQEGVRLVGISPDRPEALRETAEKLNLRFELYSDSDMEAARALGLAFVVSPEIREEYREYGIDLVEASGETHYQLPVPAVYLVSTDGNILYAHADPDYRERMEVEDILEMLDRLKEENAQ